MAEKMIIREAVIDPRWTWGELRIDDRSHIFLRLEHPQHGYITAIVPRAVASGMAEALAALAKGVS